ncbi:hypothetical protein B0A52_02282 [Exophiala mesophila]|uniref:Peptidase A1 domain-containing protein n=1 Tax=Exophiala mesophila TaxID=212818 RepID=A0A438NBJ8_EXOME|nr:hypothetical protein B0A52_02282 [Exophiala mesophila]
MSKAIVAALLVSQISLSCAKLTSTPVAYLGLGDAGAIPVIDAYDFEVNDAGVWNVDVGGDYQWSKPYTLHSQAQRRGLQPLESKAISPQYSIDYETTGTCSSDITVMDADTGEVIVKPRNLNVGLWGIEKERRIVFGLRTYATLGIGINCGQVSWAITTSVAHYTFGATTSDESKRRASTHRPPLIGIRSGFY